MIFNMANWTYNDVEGVLEHITLREKYRDGVLAGYQLRAHEGYAIYDTTEELYTDPETGETYPPTYSYQVSCGVMSNYMRYAAVPITPDMEVVGGTPGTEIA
jgi:hypothetical protein